MKKISIEKRVVTMIDEKTQKIIEYSNNLDYQRLKLSEEKITEMKELYKNNPSEHQWILKNLQREIERKDKFNARRREDRKVGKQVKEKLLEKERVFQEQKKLSLEKKSNAKRNYKKEKCASLQVFLEKDLVFEFKEKAKEMNLSQAEIIREFLEDFIEQD